MLRHMHTDQGTGGNRGKLHDIYSIKYTSFHHIASILEGTDLKSVPGIS